MKLITRDTDYAIRAICFMAKEEKEIASVSELVNCLKIPRPFLRKILQTLNKKGLLRSVKGKSGGFILNNTVNKILLLDLIKVFQGPLELNECTFKKKICPEIKVCLLKRKVDKIHNYVINELKNIRIADLMK